MDLREVYLNEKQLKDGCPMCGSEVLFYEDYTECECSNKECGFGMIRGGKYIKITYSIETLHKKDKTKNHNWKKKKFYD